MTRRARFVRSHSHALEEGALSSAGLRRGPSRQSQATIAAPFFWLGRALHAVVATPKT